MDDVVVTEWGELDWWEHDAAVEPLAWGRNTYTIIRLEAALIEAAASAGTRRIAGWVDEVEVNVGINRADVIPDAFLYCGPALLRRLEVRVGDGVHLRVRPADPDLVMVASDVSQALTDADAWELFNSRRPAERRRLLHPIDNAARTVTRHKRIQTMLRSLT